MADALSDKNEKVRRRVMATLGELLFYVATQQQVRKPSILVSPSMSCHPVKFRVLACLLVLSTSTTVSFGLHIFRTALDCAGFRVSDAVAQPEASICRALLPLLPAGLAQSHLVCERPHLRLSKCYHYFGQTRWLDLGTGISSRVWLH